MSKGYGKLQLSIIEALKVGEEHSLWSDTIQVTRLLSITRQAAHRALKRLVLDGVVYHRYAVADPICCEGLPKRTNEYLLAELEAENELIEGEYQKDKADRQAKDEAAAQELGIDVKAYQVRQMLGGMS